MKAISGLKTLLILIPLLLVACDKNVVVDVYEHVDNSVWTWDDFKSYSFEIDDIESQYDILIQLRHTTDYPMSNLYLFVEVTGPSGQSLRDTINYPIAEPSGKWIGKGNGNIREIRYMYRNQTHFPDKGIYSIKLEQGMRDPKLPVSDIGIRVEKVIP